jgi:hypothetical protein
MLRPVHRVVPLERRVFPVQPQQQVYLRGYRIHRRQRFPCRKEQLRLRQQVELGTRRRRRRRQRLAKALWIIALALEDSVRDQTVAHDRPTKR